MFVHRIVVYCYATNVLKYLNPDIYIHIYTYIINEGVISLRWLLLRNLLILKWICSWIWHFISVECPASLLQGEPAQLWLVCSRFLLYQFKAMGGTFWERNCAAFEVKPLTENIWVGLFFESIYKNLWLK